MAKNNLFLGTGAGSVGDVVVYRRSGAQVSRVRVRDVANPRTTSQSTQRNFLAPVAKFYAPLAVVLEKSFEGLTKSASYSAFLKKNIEKARNNGWYLDKGTPFFPLPYQLSRGTIAPVNYSFMDDHMVVVSTVQSQAQTIGALSHKFVALGYKEGDQVTFIVVNRDSEGNFYPSYGRFIIESNSTMTTLAAMPDLNIYQANTNINISGRGDFVAGAVIISRWENNQWRRSTQSLMVIEDIMANVTSEAARKSAIASYGDNAYTNDGDVYLDGAGTAFNIAAEDGTALLFYGGQSKVSYIEDGDTTFILVTPANKNVPFYVRIGQVSTHYLSGAAGAEISSWQKSESSPADATAANTIVVESATTDMAQYLMSIGVAPSILS